MPALHKKPLDTTLVVSDFHLGTGPGLAGGYRNLLEDFFFDEEFSAFLDFHCSDEFAHCSVELVLNGDILNLIQVDDLGVHSHLHTERGTCRALRRIFDGHPDFFDALSRFARFPRRRLSYVIGNHDAAMLWPAAQALFEKRVGAAVQFHPVSYRLQGVHIEHGQQHEELARLDMDRPFLTDGLPEPVLNLPWGSLFVSVLLSRIKRERSHVDKVKPFPEFLRHGLLHDTWWTLSTLVRLGWFVWETVLLKSSYRLGSGVETTWSMIRGLSVYPDFDHAARAILDGDPEIDAVVFGHSHVLRNRRFADGKLYINEGSWNEATHLELGDYGKQVRLTYAQIAQGRVTLRQWRGYWRPEFELRSPAM